MSAVLTGSFSGSLSGSGQTVTVSTPLLNLTQTWNAGGVTFTGAVVNVTDTASASGSLLLDLQKGGASQFSVSKSGVVGSGTVQATNTASSGFLAGVSGTIQWNTRAQMFSPADGVIAFQSASGGIIAVAGLPAAASGNKGARSMVSDANATTFNSIVAAGGANTVPVFSDGTNWRIG